MDATANQLFSQGLEGFWGRGFIDKMKTRLPRLLDDGLDPIDEHSGTRRLVAADVVEADVAKAAFLPVAPVGDGELVPAAIAP